MLNKHLCTSCYAREGYTAVNRQVRAFPYTLSFSEKQIFSEYHLVRLP